MNRRLPVTLVGGFLGAGKTSALHHFISGHQGGHLAVLVENVGALNHDARALRGLCGAMRRQFDAVLEIPSGDEAEQVRWIAARLREFSLAGKFEQVLIEVGGVSNVARLARHFEEENFSSWVQVHQLVTVVDALDFYRAARRDGSDTMFGFQKAQIEGASLVVLNKCDLISDAERNACVRALHEINREASIMETAYGEIPPEIWARPATAVQLGYALEERKAMTDDDDSLAALSGTVYRAWRPFHPQRFWNWFESDHPGLLRMKGLVWLATRSLLVGGVSRTRWQNSCGPAGIWWAALPREDWPEETDALLQMQETWREPYGDRRQELSLIGDAKQLAGITASLNGCFLTAEEMARPVQEWVRLPDPFPAWDLAEG